ncbi:TonB-dependent receptor plug domain-containing protein [Massilia yuzhufengensis]|uniref:Outer membrane receptor for ferrienterochelin and colicins n=1 Tax=Massilia yuzhufengensis TaxID=1164594 RepID=A0A1I1PLP9_9BURK|nr:TonB-dependent receptor [Massilia yuzhufengensis]SFD10809.1 Outer membrane receptor for ferrienterochelin and colicins [Massilia yuzhufengensis]
MSLFIPFRLTALAAALSICLPALAQDKPATTKPEDSKKIQQVEVKGSADSYDPRRDDTATKVVVNSDEIVKYGDTSVLDVLKRVPGITVNSANGRGGEIRMRGLGSGYTQVLVNGERAPAGFTLEALAPESIERIEVLRAASAEFSTQSVAGTINIILKRSVKNRLREVKLAAQASSSSFGPNANLQMSDRDGGFSYSVSASAAQERFDSEATGIEVGTAPGGATDMLRTLAMPQDGQFTFLNLSPRLNWTLAPDNTITSQSFISANRFRNNVHQRTTTLIGSAPLQPDLRTHMGNEGASLATDLSWARKFADGAKLDLKLGISGSEGENLSDRRGAGLDTRVVSENTDRGFKATGKYTRTLDKGHTLAFGWDGSVDDRDDERVERAVFAGPAGQLPDEFTEARVKRLAVFGQDEWNITPQWSMYLGARWEGIRTHVEGNTFGKVDASSSVWSPIMQTLYKLPGSKGKGGDQFRLALTRTYKAPGIGNLSPNRRTSENNSSTQPDYVGNPNLKPELAFGVDISYEHYWAEGALVSVSASSRRISDFTRSLTYFDGARWVVTPSNQDSAVTRTLEIETKFPLKAVMVDAPPIDLRASINRNWSRVESVPGPNNRLDQQTPLTVNLGADYKAGSLSAGGSFAYRTGGQVRSSLNQYVYTWARRDLEAYALWKFDPKRQLRVALANVLGDDFFYENTYADPRFGTQTRSVIFPNSIRVRATYELKF